MALRPISLAHLTPAPTTATAHVLLSVSMTNMASANPTQIPPGFWDKPPPSLLSLRQGSASSSHSHPSAARAQVTQHIHGERSLPPGHPVQPPSHSQMQRQSQREAMAIQTDAAREHKARAQSPGSSQPRCTRLEAFRATAPHPWEFPGTQEAPPTHPDTWD